MTRKLQPQSSDTAVKRVVATGWPARQTMSVTTMSPRRKPAAEDCLVATLRLQAVDMRHAAGCAGRAAWLPPVAFEKSVRQVACVVIPVRRVVGQRLCLPPLDRLGHSTMWSATTAEVASYAWAWAVANGSGVGNRRILRCRHLIQMATAQGMDVGPPSAMATDAQCLARVPCTPAYQSTPCCCALARSLSPDRTSPGKSRQHGTALSGTCNMISEGLTYGR